MARPINFGLDPAWTYRLLTQAVTVSMDDVTDRVVCRPNSDTEVSGCVDIVVSEPVEILGCDIFVMGQSISNPLAAADIAGDIWSRSPQAWPMVAQYGHTRDHVTHLAHQYGRDPPQEGSPEYPVQVQASLCHPKIVQEAFRFQFKESVPETWKGNKQKNAFIQYWLSARVRYTCTNRRLVRGYTRIREAWTTYYITLRNSFTLTTVDSINPHLHNTGIQFDRACKSKFVGLWGEKKEVYCELRLPIRGFLLGDVIPAHVVICNNSGRRIRKVSLHFIQEFTIRSRKTAHMVKAPEEADCMELEPVPPRSDSKYLALGLRVPYWACTDGSFPNCPLVDVRFLVRPQTTKIT